MRRTASPPASLKRSTTAAPGNGPHVAFHAGERETVVGTPAGKVRAAAGAGSEVFRERVSSGTGSISARSHSALKVSGARSGTVNWREAFRRFARDSAVAMGSSTAFFLA